jgi:hypothetical protein
MFARFFPATYRAEDFAATVPVDAVKMAAIQGHLLAHVDEDEAIRTAPWAQLRAA